MVKKVIINNKFFFFIFFIISLSDEMDIIIGPMYSNLFQIMCEKYGQDATKILISPLSRDNKGIKMC